MWKTLALVCAGGAVMAGILAWRENRRTEPKDDDVQAFSPSLRPLDDGHRDVVEPLGGQDVPGGRAEEGLHDLR